MKCNPEVCCQWKAPGSARRLALAPRRRSPRRSVCEAGSSPKTTVAHYAAETFIRNNPTATYEDFVKRRGNVVSLAEFNSKLKDF